MSNTKVEGLSRFGLLKFTTLLGVSDISISRDSKVLIDWMNGSSNIQLLAHKKWCRKVQDLRRTFSRISLSHISRIYNRRVDELSKSAISLKFGFLRVEEYVEGSLIYDGEANILDLI